MEEAKLKANRDRLVHFLVIDSRDNVAVALQNLEKGDQCKIEIGSEVKEVILLEDIKFGHKVALKSMSKNESVLKYGEVIGKMDVDVKKGEWIHNHNMSCDRGMK